MQCEVKSVSSVKWINGNDVPEGSLAMDAEGNVYYRTYFSLTCLNDYGATLSGTRTPCTDKFMVTVLPKGSVVTLTQK